MLVNKNVQWANVNDPLKRVASASFPQNLKMKAGGQKVWEDKSGQSVAYRMAFAHFERPHLAVLS